MNDLMSKEQNAKQSISNQLTSLYDKLNKVNKSQFMVKKPRQSEEYNRRSRRTISDSSSSEDEEKNEARAVPNTILMAQEKLQPCYVKFYKYESVKEKYDDTMNERDRRRQRLKEKLKDFK